MTIDDRLTDTAFAAGPLGPIERYVLAIRLKGYLGAHDDAVALADAAIERFGDDVHLRRLRGEKRLIVRDLLGALDDLEFAAERVGAVSDADDYYRLDVERLVVELVLGEAPAGTHHRVHGRVHGPVRAVTWRNLGIARYLTGDFAGAAAAFAHAAELVAGGHVLASVVDWGYMSLQRAGQPERAAALLAAYPAIDVGEGLVPGADDVSTALATAYGARLHLYRGALRPEDLLRNDVGSPLAVATLGYGVANWYLYHGHTIAAVRALHRVVELGEPTSFSFIAAEVDLARLDGTALASPLAPFSTPSSTP